MSMEWRNAQFTKHDTPDVRSISCEINHPEFGWIPFHAKEDDNGAAFDVPAMIAEMVASGQVDAYVEPSHSAPTSADVNAERERRLFVGKGFTPTGHGTPVMVNALDEPNLTGLATVALAQINAGNGSTTITWRDNNNVSHTLTYYQVVELHAQAAEYKQQLYNASWILKDIDPIPTDYTDDAHWTA